MGRRNTVREEEEAPEGGVTLDAGALIAYERRDRFTVALLARAREVGTRTTIPASVLAQVMRDPARQARIQLLVHHSATDLVPLDIGDAIGIGTLLGASRTTDIVDAHVVLCAMRARQPIVTSDPHDLERLDPEAELIVV